MVLAGDHGLVAERIVDAVDDETQCLIQNSDGGLVQARPWEPRLGRRGSAERGQGVGRLRRIAVSCRKARWLSSLQLSSAVTYLATPFSRSRIPHTGCRAPASGPREGSRRRAATSVLRP